MITLLLTGDFDFLSPKAELFSLEGANEVRLRFLGGSFPLTPSLLPLFPFSSSVGDSSTSITVNKAWRVVAALVAFFLALGLLHSCE